jgi:hypothetical protein
MMEPELAEIENVPDSLHYTERVGKVARREMRLVAMDSHSTLPPPRVERLTLILYVLNADIKAPLSPPWAMMPVNAPVRD